MKKLFRRIFSFLFLKVLVLTGVVKLRIRYILKNYIPLALYFHNPDKELFEDIILWFKNEGFKFLSVQEFLLNFENKKKIKGAAWVSFDDGYEENLTNVLPILKKYQIPATFFISTKSIEEGFFWWDLVSSNSFADLNHLWKIPNKERVKIISSINKEILSISKRTISLQSLKKLSSYHLITIGNHTDDHVICNNCSNEELNREIKICEAKLLEWVGDKYVRMFSYPNGDYDNRVKNIVKNNDMIAAFTNEPKLIKNKNDLYLIPRMGVVDNLSFSENLLHAIGIWQPLVNKFKKIICKALP